MNFIEIGNPKSPTVVFAHGWGRNHADFFAISEALNSDIHAILLDFPGFGDSKRPKEAWSTIDYAKNANEFLQQKGFANYVWVGHSFGGRIGLRLAVLYPESVNALVLIGSAGIPRQKTVSSKLKSNFRSRLFKIKKKKAQSQEEIETLELQYGSADYVESRALGMRDIFLNTVNEDQSKALPGISCPTELIYGDQDKETPSKLGQQIRDLIPEANLTILPEMGHIDILSRGRHIIALRVKELLSVSGQ